MRVSRLAPVALALLLASTGSARAQAARQSGSPAAAASASAFFTASDALEITSYAVGDLTDDGRWLAVTASLRRDSYGADYRRDGDPTYVRANPVRLMVVDTRSGTTQPVFADKRTVRAMRWAPDGRRLAMLMLTGEFFEPAIWDRSTGKTVTLHLPAGKYVAETSDLRWTADGMQVVVAVHTLEWRKKARDIFATMTAGPVFVQSSKDPFLAWDDIRRMGSIRSVVAVDAATSQVRELVPEAMVGNYTLAEDGSAITFAPDVAKKTD